RSRLIVAVGALALLVASLDTAAARSPGARSFGGGMARGFSARSFAGPRFHAGPAFRAPRIVAGSHLYSRHHHHHHRHFRRGIIIGAPLAFYGGYGYYGYSSPCGWLYRKAVITGSPYWWSRYEACL